jgi:hypothetical protein
MAGAPQVQRRRSFDHDRRLPFSAEMTAGGSEALRSAIRLMLQLAGATWWMHGTLGGSRQGRIGSVRRA